MTPELTVLALAAILQVVQISLAGAAMNRDAGVEYNASPRDEKRQCLGDDRAAAAGGG